MDRVRVHSAHALAHATRQRGGRPRRLVLFDPPPPPLPWPSALAHSALAAISHAFSACASAHLHLGPTAGELTAPGKVGVPPVEPTSASAHMVAGHVLELQMRGLHAGCDAISHALTELESLPEDALPTFVAETLALHAASIAGPREVLYMARALRAAPQLVAALHSFTLLGGPIQPYEGSDGRPAILLVLASARDAAFRPEHGFAEQTADGHSRAHLYGATSRLVTVEGEHLDVCNQCTSHSAPEVADAVEAFLAVGGEAEASVARRDAERSV
jgi:hypothetical protein